jgi:hypothetical protein
MLTHTPRWSHPPGNTVVPSRWQATAGAWTAHVRSGVHVSLLPACAVGPANATTSGTGPEVRDPALDQAHPGRGRPGCAGISPRGVSRLRPR